MIKMSGTTQGDKPLLLLGLSKGNCEELLKGRPIAFNTREEGMPFELVVVITGGETEDAITAELAKHFDLPPVHRKDN